jgi:type IV secretion system protein VirB10
MRSWLGVVLVLSLVMFAVAEQQPEETGPPPTRAQDSVAPSNRSAGAVPDEEFTVPSGTKVPLVLKQAISTKDAHVGDAVYAQTNFPVTQNGRILIPPGTYVQGVIASVKRAGRGKGRAEVLFHFTTMIFPNGYTVTMPGSVEGVPGAQHSRVKGEEGKVQQEGERGKEAGQIAGTAATGAAIGGIAGQGAKGVGIGAGIGGATGLAIALLKHGNDVRLESGTGIEMVLSRPITLDPGRIGR